MVLTCPGSSMAKGWAWRQASALLVMALACHRLCRGPSSCDHPSLGTHEASLLRAANECTSSACPSLSLAFQSGHRLLLRVLRGQAFEKMRPSVGLGNHLCGLPAGKGWHCLLACVLSLLAPAALEGSVCGDGPRLLL